MDSEYWVRDFKYSLAACSWFRALSIHPSITRCLPLCITPPGFLALTPSTLMKTIKMNPEPEHAASEAVVPFEFCE